MKVSVSIVEKLARKLLTSTRASALSIDRHRKLVEIKKARAFRDSLLKEVDLSSIKLDGHYTKLLKAFASANGLAYRVGWYTAINGISIALDVCAVVGNQLSAIDVFENGQVASVGLLSRHCTKWDSNIVEDLSKEICETIVGPSKYLKSMKGGGYLASPFMTEGKCVWIDHWSKKSPTSLDAMAIEIDVAGASIESSTARLCWNIDEDVTAIETSRLVQHKSRHLCTWTV